MANLNWYWIYVPYLDEPDRQAESALRAGYNKVVFKDEADKVIAELTKKLDLYKRGFKEDDKINAYLYVELRHQKYKRCLTMAEINKAKRALWLARVERAMAESYSVLNDVRTANKWAKILNKLKAKAEAYK